MTSEPRTRATLVRFLEDEFGLKAGSYNDTSALFSSGLLDSFALAIVLAFLDERFDVHVSSEDLTQTNLDSVQSLTAYVTRVISARRA